MAKRADQELRTERKRIQAYYQDWTRMSELAREYGYTPAEIAEMCLHIERHPKRFCRCCGELLRRKLGEPHSTFIKRHYTDPVHSGHAPDGERKPPPRQPALQILSETARDACRWLMGREVGHTSDRRLWAWRMLRRRYR